MGVIIPVAMNIATLSMDNATGAIVLKVITLAIVPLMVARIAYRHGFDSASGRDQLRKE